jgi:diacylglycerol O-acyltransferase
METTMSQLAGQDASFLYLENDSIKSHFSVLTVYDQSELKAPLRYRDILAYFNERVSAMPVFRRKLYPVPLQLDAPYFADDPHFNIESHVRHIALPKPGDWRQFCILAAQIQAVPIDMGKPLWDMHIIEGLDQVEGLPKGSFAIITRLHHAIADGTTARGILMALHHPKGQAPEDVPVVFREAPPSAIEMFLRGSLNNARQISAIPRRLAKLLPASGPKLGRVAASALNKWLATDDEREAIELADKAKVPASIFNTEMEYRRVFQLRRYPLQDIKRIRTLAPGATLNDTVLTLIGGALRRYLEASGEKHDINLVALCPINLREDKFGNDSVQGNNISLMQVNLNTRTAAPAKRMGKVLDATTKAKLAQKASTAKDLIALSQNAPNLLVALGTRLAMLAAFRGGSAVRLGNCIITNVPGPQEPLYFMGARLELFSGLAPISPGSGLTFPVTSYCGQLCIAFTGCPGWVKDPQLLASCLDDSFAEMLAAADTSQPGTKPLKRSPARAARKTASPRQPAAEKASGTPKSS